MTAVRRAPTAQDIAQDSALAMTLASYATSTGPAADELRKGLRSYIGLLADPAQAYADALEEGRAKDIAQSTVRHARTVAQSQGTDPAATLRLLAKSTDLLLRYAAHAQQQGTQHN
ncbi:hypothetical protein ACWGI8_31930 [Streptomyces sp. NPDC054841]